MAANEMAEFKGSFFATPSKAIAIEILGGGDADSLSLDTRDPNISIADHALGMYQLTHGGKVGYSMVGMSVANVIRLRSGEALTDYQQGGQPHYYTVVARLEDDNEIFLLMLYTAGRDTWLKDETGLVPGWVNKAIHKFNQFKDRFDGLDMNRMIEFWILQDLRNEVGTVIDRSLIEDGYRDGPIEVKCNTILSNILAHEKVEATYFIDDELIYFRPGDEEKGQSKRRTK